MFKRCLILPFLGAIFFIVGCTNQVQVNLDEIEHVKVTLSDFEETDEQFLYVLTLHNGTSHAIKQNTASLIYTIQTENGSKGSSAVFKAQGNKLDIQPNEKVGLTIVVPKDELPNPSKIIKDYVTLSIDGFFEEVTQENSFHLGRRVEIP